MRKALVATALATLLVASPLQAQQSVTPDQAMQAELVALRQSVDRIAALLEQLVQQAARRDTAQLLMSRIEMAERRVEPFVEELNRLRAARADQQTERTGYGQALDSVDAMEKTDRSGANAAAFQAERQRIAGLIATADSELAETDGQIARLETEIAVRRQAIDGMDAQLAQLFGGD